jgi:uridine kinase
MKTQVPSLATALADLHAEGRTFLVAIDGAGGSGKSFLADALLAELTSHNVLAEVVHFDDFYLPSALRSAANVKPIGANFDWRRLRDQVIQPLRVGGVARYFPYDWATDQLAATPRQVPPGTIVLIEGVYSSRRELAPLYDWRIWVECPRALRLARGVARDGEAARGIWENDWMPSEDLYIHEHRPQEYADLTVSGAPA